MVISQGDVWWANLPEPAGSAPGYRGPVVVVQGDSFNQSYIRTVVCVPVTSNLKWADSPGNVLLAARTSGLSRDSVANVSLITALDVTDLEEHVGKLGKSALDLVLTGIDAVLGR